MTTSRRGRGRAVDQRERQQAIRDFVGEAGHRTVDEIAEHTGVSSMTVYRDLAELEGLGLLRLSKGVVTAAASNLHEAASRYRLTQQVAEKQALARAALELIDPGSAIMLDDSTTGVFLARLLGERLPLTVVTNYLEVAREVQEDRDIRLLVTGGEYLVWADAFFGPMTVAAIKAMRADAVFMSASAIIDGNVYHPTEAPAEVKRAMLASAQLKVLFADHTKFNRSALHQVAPLADFDVLIVDDATPGEAVAAAAEGGVRVVRAARAGRRGA